MSVAINGIAHIYITVQNLERVLEFYKGLTDSFGMMPLVETDELYYAIGARTGLGVRQGNARVAYDQYNAGLHHLCFRARSREDVDICAGVVRDLGGSIVHEPQEDGWAPGYYSVLFEDPGGTRLEVNFVPGKGHLREDAHTPLSDDTQKQLSNR
ncbi:MAG: VOC family protein [Pseudomonadales bacterium]|jgi:catechol 2,3-dioxygenase-like lactoylglutathione lyase family enzyme|nr:VOC family protein [Pseudomonadales bacterium]MDP6472684.1 VOC family protein [Pseudomonadales bacterium]MDP6827896.1 VOC family protein [Pseudomonadales bacterium]MDP6972704.1 VOC family protein [Pseudomonadales bacterium]|tara:strand:- start:1340 stop:1804 length:465 start_codon:yes stop_codon:yes gene_type:complete